MTIEKAKKGYVIRDEKGAVLGRFPTLATAGMAARYLRCENLTINERVYGLRCILESEVKKGKKRANTC